MNFSVRRAIDFLSDFRRARSNCVGQLLKSDCQYVFGSKPILALKILFPALVISTITSCAIWKFGFPCFSILLASRRGRRLVDWIYLENFAAVVVDGLDGDFASVRQGECPAPADFKLGLKRYSHISSLCRWYLPHIPGPAFYFPIAGQPTRK